MSSDVLEVFDEKLDNILSHLFKILEILLDNTCFEDFRGIIRKLDKMLPIFEDFEVYVKDFDDELGSTTKLWRIRRGI